MGLGDEAEILCPVVSASTVEVQSSPHNDPSDIQAGPGSYEAGGTSGLISGEMRDDLF